MKNFIYGLLLTILVFAGSCKKKDEVSDPCKGYQPLSADFIIEQELTRNQNGSLEGLVKAPVHHTVRIGDRSVFLTARQDMDSYEWRIGTDDRVWKTKTVEISFGRPNEKIKIMLIGKRKANKACGSDSKEVDTVYRYIETVNFPDFPILGKYKGVESDHPTDSFTVALQSRPNTPWDPTIRLYNFPKGSGISNLIMTPEAFLYEGNGIITADFKYYGNTGALGTLSEDYQTLTIDFEYGDSTDLYLPQEKRIPRKRKHFVGQRIN